MPANWLERGRLLLTRLPVRDRESHKMVPFRFNPNQERRFERMKDQWNREGKIRIIDLKSRRVGVSAQTEALLWCYGLGFPNMNIKIVAHLTGSAEEIFRIPYDLSRAFPSFASDDILTKRIHFPHKGGASQITIATAGTKDAGRGATHAALHLDEAAFYPSDDSFTAMITSVSKGPGSIIVITSTANGREGPGQAFFEYWKAAEEGKNGYIPSFLCWLDDPAAVRPEEEAEDAPSDDLEKELMGEPFNATREQIAWMRRTKADDCRDIESKWLQDFPHHPRVAFVVTGEPAFARDEIAYAEKTVREPIARGRFVRSGATVRFVPKPDGPVLIWKFPYDDKAKSDGFKYYIGADSAAGTQTGDFAAWVALCGQTGELAARFAERMDPEAFADQLDMAGRWYNNAIVNPELTGGLGRWTLIKLRDTFRYPNIYTWKGRDDKKRGRVTSRALGFEMNQATRRLIIDAARSGLRMGMREEAGGLIVNDRALMSQIDLCTLKEWRWEVERDHDDVLVAWMISCLTREQYPPMRMTFAPKNVYEDTKTSTLEGLKMAPTENDLLFLREMRRIRAAAGLRPDMRGIGRRRIDRLAGI
jgi:hypothetical protein